MIRKSLLFALLAVAPMLLTMVPAHAITGPGEIDTVHTNVGVVRFTTTAGRFRCSGTLIAPKVVLTAGKADQTPWLIFGDPQADPGPAGGGDQRRRAA